MSYQQKYLKYKAKYLELKNQFGGETIEQIKSLTKDRLIQLAEVHLSNINKTKDTDRYLINFTSFIIATKLRLDELAKSNTDLTDLQTRFNNKFDITINNGVAAVTLKQSQIPATKAVEASVAAKAAPVAAKATVASVAAAAPKATALPATQATALLATAPAATAPAATSSSQNLDDVKNRIKADIIRVGNCVTKDKYETKYGCQITKQNLQNIVDFLVEEIPKCSQAGISLQSIQNGKVDKRNPYGYTFITKNSENNEKYIKIIVFQHSIIEYYKTHSTESSTSYTSYMDILKNIINLHHPYEHLKAMHPSKIKTELFNRYKEADIFTDTEIQQFDNIQKNPGTYSYNTLSPDTYQKITDLIENAEMRPLIIPEYEYKNYTTLKTEHYKKIKEKVENILKVYKMFKKAPEYFINLTGYFYHENDKYKYSSMDNNGVITSHCDLKKGNELYIVIETGLDNLYNIINKNTIKISNISLIKSLSKLFDFYKISNKLCTETNKNFLIHGNIKLQNLILMNDKKTIKIDNLDEVLQIPHFFTNNGENSRDYYHNLAFYGVGYAIYSPLYDIFCMIICILDVFACKSNQLDLKMCMASEVLLNPANISNKIGEYESIIQNAPKDISSYLQQLLTLAHHIHLYNLALYGKLGLNAIKESQLTTVKQIEEINKKLKEHTFNDFFELINLKDYDTYKNTVKYINTGKSGCDQMNYLEAIVSAYLSEGLLGRIAELSDN